MELLYTLLVVWIVMEYFWNSEERKYNRNISLSIENIVNKEKVYSIKTHNIFKILRWLVKYVLDRL
jgi:hypothetical protein